jgi:hypothetical protein
MGYPDWVSPPGATLWIEMGQENATAAGVVGAFCGNHKEENLLLESFCCLRGLFV